jgi:A/G-specific adenine glycosylase
MARDLARWATQHGRAMPWRTSPSAYELAVAEVLLQKTKAADAEPVWNGLLAAYPTAASLAVADPAAVQEGVESLGLGRQRTLRLIAMARSMVERGERIRGLGPYGQAVLALTFGTDEVAPPVDGNIARVITRLFGFSFVRGEPRKKREVRDAVSRILGSSRTPAERLAIVYALVDLGAIVCSPSAPRCGECPLSRVCAKAQPSGKLVTCRA